MLFCLQVLLIENGHRFAFCMCMYYLDKNIILPLFLRGKDFSKHKIPRVASLDQVHVQRSNKQTK
jgi:hypothetical protein